MCCGNRKKSNEIIDQFKLFTLPEDCGILKRNEFKLTLRHIAARRWTYSKVGTTCQLTDRRQLFFTSSFPKKLNTPR